MRFSLSSRTNGLLARYNIVTKEIKINLTQVVKYYDRFQDIIDGIPFERFAIEELSHVINHELLHKIIHDLEEKRMEYFDGEEKVINNMLSYVNIYPIAVE